MVDPRRVVPIHDCTGRPNFGKSLLFLVLVWLSFPDAEHLTAAEHGIEFNRDILPLLSENCFSCHGPDQANREAGLRLDQRQGAFAELESGQQGIVAGSSQQSAVFLRISVTNSDRRMPPVDSGKTLSAEDIGRIKQWIDEGG
jgi:hypothetical protein